MRKPNNLKYTDQGICIDQRIREFKTLFFDTLAEAKEFAGQFRSYPYPVYNDSKEIVGFAVPK